MASKLELEQGKVGEYRVELIATTGQTTAVSQGCTSKESPLKGVGSVKRKAGSAPVVVATIRSREPGSPGRRCALRHVGAPPCRWLNLSP